MNHNSLYYSNSNSYSNYTTVRSDSYSSLFKDINAGKSVNTTFQFNIDSNIDDIELDNEYIHNSMFAKVIDTYPDEATKKYLEFEDIDANKETNNEAQIKIIEDFLEEKNLYQILNRALKLNDRNGAALIVFIFSNDTGTNEQIDKKFKNPVKLGRAVDLIRCMIYEKQSIVDKVKDFAGNWQYFTVSTTDGIKTYHASRCVFLNGVYKGERAEQDNNGFGYPRMTRTLLNAIRDYNARNSMINDFMTEATTSVTKMSDLTRRLANKSDAEKKAIITQLQLSDMSRSFLKTRLIDSNDDFQRTDISNLKDVIICVEASAKDLVAQAKIPMTKLLGTSPSASLGSQSGSYETREFYDNVQSYMRLYCVPFWNKVLDIVGQLKGISGRKFKKIRYDLPNLYVLSELEEAQEEKLEAEARKIEAEAIKVEIENKKMMDELGLVMVDDELVNINPVINNPNAAINKNKPQIQDNSNIQTEIGMSSNDN